MKKHMGNKDLARIVVLILVFVLIGSGFGMRLVKIQVVDGSYYVAQSKKSTTSAVSIPAARGEIVDRNGESLAVNRMGFNVVLEKAFVQDEYDVILKLAHLLTECGEEYIDELPISRTAPYSFEENRDSDIKKLISDLGLNVWATADHVMTAFKERYGLDNYTQEEVRIISGIKYTMVQKAYSSNMPYVFAEDISLDTATQIKENSQNYQGADIQETYFREYVDGDLVPHIVGTMGAITAEQYAKLKEEDSSYTQNDIVGQTGVEDAFRQSLKGQDGIREIVQDSSGGVISDKIVKDAVPGNTIMLTIDKNLQRVAKNALISFIKNMNETAKAGEGKDADSGAVVVMDVNSGEVLASVSYPDFDLSTYEENKAALLSDTTSPLYNRAFWGSYMPGSIFKPMMAIAGLSEGVITPSTIFTCTKTWTFFGPLWPFTCMEYHGPVNVTNALRVSCNIFFYETGWRLGIENIQKYAKQFGLGVSTGVEIGEFTGVLAGPEERKSQGQDWYDGDVVQASIGQSDNLFSPLQLAQYVATIANGGTRYKAHVVKEVKTYNQDEVVQDIVPVVLNTVDSDANNFLTVQEGMHMVAQSVGGSAYSVFKDYPIQVACKTGTPQNSENDVSNDATFIAYAPADDPQIAVSVVVKHGFAGYKAAVIARDIFDAYFKINTASASSSTSSVS